LTAEATAAIAVLQAHAGDIDTQIRHLAVRLDAATLAAEDLEALRAGVKHLAHQVISLRTAVQIFADLQEQIDAAAAAPAATPGKGKAA
jgi:hypothetical protein